MLHSDLFDTMISRQSFGLLWLNPPYGDLVADHSGASQYQGSGRRRLEKAFYQRCLPLLQYGGVMVLIVPHYVLDDELTGWLSNHFTGLRIYAAADPTFKQVVIFGIRVRRQDLARADANQVRSRLQAIGAGQEKAGGNSSGLAVGTLRGSAGHQRAGALLPSNPGAGAVRR